METFANFTAVTTLAAGCDADDTELTVASAAGLDTGGTLRVRIGDELLLVTSVAGNVLTVTRGIESTAAAAHASGATVSPVLTAGALNDRFDEIPAGEQGEPGPAGDDGASAYEIWLANGNAGTELDFLASLVGEPGEQGEPGPAGEAPDDVVIGPASATDSALVRFDGVTGKLVKVNDTNGIAFSEIVQLAALSILGNATNGATNLAAIAAGSDHAVLRRLGTALAFGAINLASANAVTGLLPAANLAALALSEVWVTNGNGYGSNATRWRRWSVEHVNTGGDITYADSSTDGGSFTIVTDGLYFVARSDARAGGTSISGVSRNSNQPTANYTTITAAHRTSMFDFAAAGFFTFSSSIMRLSAGDTLHGHDNTTLPDNTSFECFMRVIKVGN